MNVNEKKKSYQSLVNKKSPPSKLVKNLCLSFVSGGLICVFGECVREWLLMLKLSETDASSLTSSLLIAFGAILTGVGVYDNMARYARAGTLVPITGFANSIVSSAMEYRTEGFILGVGAKMFTIAGPVLVYGISASVLYGILYFLLK